jgi:hypothetical protein
MMRCLCNHCSTPIEFEDGIEGQEVVCPACEKQTILYDLEARQLEEKEKRARARKEQFSYAANVAGETLGAAAEVGAMAAKQGAKGAMTIMEFLFKLSVVFLILGGLAFGWVFGGAVGLLLGILIIVTYNGFEEVRKEIKALKR